MSEPTSLNARLIVTSTICCIDSSGMHDETHKHKFRPSKPIASNSIRIPNHINQDPRTISIPRSTHVASAFHLPKTTLPPFSLTCHLRQLPTVVYVVGVKREAGLDWTASGAPKRT